MTHRPSLSDLVAETGGLVAPGAYDALSARLAQHLGFPAIYLTGFGASASRIGKPDLGLLTQSEMLDHARNLTRAVKVPIIADADTGYGGSANIERTVLDYIQVGVSAIHLEDQALPKRCGHMTGVTLVSAEEHVARLRTGIEARGDSALSIIARTDALGINGVDDAVARAARYADAGADLLFVDGVKRIEDAETIARSLDHPKILASVPGTEVATLTTRELHELGFDVILYPLNALFAAALAVERSLSVLLGEDARADAADLYRYDDFNELLGMREYSRIDTAFENLAKGLAT